MDTLQKFAQAKYIIYCNWTTKSISGGSISGSYYYNEYPSNEREAIEMLEKVKKNADEFNAKYPSINTTHIYGYHLNQSEWWTHKN